MNKEKDQKSIIDGKTALGIEFGTTRIKAVLLNEELLPIASGSHGWENRYENGVWTIFHWKTFGQAYRYKTSFRMC